MTAAAWRRSTPLILDGLAFGLDPQATVRILAARPDHAHLRVVLHDLQAGRSLADALGARGAPLTLVSAARMGDMLSTHTVVGRRVRSAARDREDGRAILLTALALPLLTAIFAWTKLGGTTAMVSPADAGAPGWVLWSLGAMIVVGTGAAIGIAMPSVGAWAARWPGLSWIGRRQRAARLADLLAVALQADADCVAALRALGARHLAQAVEGGVPLPEALERDAVGRLIAPFIVGSDHACWPTRLADAGATLSANATERVAAWALGVRAGGTVAVAIVVAAWLIWLYSTLAQASASGWAQ